MANGILAVWSDIESSAEADYNAWYDREHMFERLEVPSFHQQAHQALGYEEVERCSIPALPPV
jgi:hypothetical protein